MPSLEGQIADALVDLATNNEPAVLAAIAPLNQKADTALLQFASKESPVIGALITQFSSQIIAALGGEEKTLYALALAEAKALAVRLGG